MGKVAAQYDEFFFNDPTVEGGTVRHKDFVSVPDGMTFLQLDEPGQPNTWYETSDGGMRIVYEPAQTHPWNHFSKTTTANAISFYQTAFADYALYLEDIAPENQIWQWKECFECVALVGFVMLIIAVATILLSLPFFSNAVETVMPQVLSFPSGAAKWITIVVLIIAILLPGLFFSPLMDDGAGSASVSILFYGGLLVGIFGAIMFCMNIVRKNQLSFIIGSCIMTIAGALLAVTAKVPMYQNNGFWTAIGMNSIAYWTLGCTLISLCITSTVYVFLKSKDGLTFFNYGVTFRPSAIISGLCTAFVTVIISYAVLFLMDALFKADFRIWTFAFKTFDFDILPAILRYLPTFLAFYLVSGVGIMINTNTTGTQGFWGYLLAIALNAGGAIIWLARQYITLFSTGVAAHPGSALSGIMLVAMVPTLSIAAIISRNLYKKTGNIWTAAFLNGILMTTMAIANTMVVFK